MNQMCHGPNPMHTRGFSACLSRSNVCSELISPHAARAAAVCRSRRLGPAEDAERLRGDRREDVHHSSCQASTWTCVRCRWLLNLLPRLLAMYKKTVTELQGNMTWCKTPAVFYFLERFCNVFELAAWLSLAAIANPSMSLTGVLDTLN